MRIALALALALTVALGAPLGAQQAGQLVNTKCPVRPTSSAKRGFVLYYNGHFIGFC